MPGQPPAGGIPGRSARPGRRLKFTAAQKLRSSWEFDRARREGQRLVRGCLVLNWRPSPGQLQSRLGVVTSRKIGNAVARARARRVLREVFRLRQHQLQPPSDLVLVARASIAGRSRGEVEKDFVAAARQANLLRPETE